MALDTIIPAAAGFYFIPVPRDTDAAAQSSWDPQRPENRRAIVGWVLTDLQPRPILMHGPAPAAERDEFAVLRPDGCVELCGEFSFMVYETIDAFADITRQYWKVLAEERNRT